MRKIKALFQVLNKVFSILTNRQKRRSIGAFFAMIFSSLLELLGVSLIVPFIMAITNADALMENQYVACICGFLGVTSSKALMLLCAAFVVVIYLLKNILLLYSRFVQSRYCHGIKQELSITMLKSYMEKPYEFFVNTNSAAIMRGVESDVNSFREILSTFFLLFAELITVILIVGFVFISNYYMALLMTILSIILVMVISFGTKGPVRHAGENNRDASTRKSKALLQFVGGIKDIYVTQRKKKFINQYEQAEENYKNSVLVYEVVNQIPERIIEFFVVSGIIAIVSVRVIRGYDVSLFIPQLAALAVACFRLLPSLNKVISAFNQVILNYPGMQNVYNNITEARC